jgi:hypothetical protein
VLQRAISLRADRCAISDTSVMACKSLANMVTDVASRIEKKQWELTALATIQKYSRWWGFLLYRLIQGVGNSRGEM